jgi:arginase family enzyme
VELAGRFARLFLCFERGLQIVGADLMELSPPNDPTGMSSCLASGIAFEMLCLLAESQARRTGIERPTHWN